MKLRRYLTAAATQPPAAVLQVSYACGLDVVRDLGRHGVPVLGLDPDPAAIGLRSRYAAGLVCPDPLADEEAFLVFLETLGRALPHRAVVFPSHDEFIWPLSRHAERLEPWFIVPFSRWDVMARVHDKRAQMEAARRAGVDTPKTVFVGSGAELEAAAGEIRFPAVLKPVESLAFKLRFHRHILDVETPAELEAHLRQGRRLRHADAPGAHPRRRRRALDGGLLPRRRVAAAGRLHRPQAAPVPARRRQLPRRRERAGTRSSPTPALRLLQELRFHGVTQVEFKRDPRDGRFNLMEVNARHWKWHWLATACGVNLSLGRLQRRHRRARSTRRRQIDGVKWIVANKDVPLALLEIAKRQRSSPE